MPRAPRTRSSETPTLVLAKTNRPTVAAVYPRARLFRLLESRRKRPIVWITAPAGAGKTTLVASYLQARRFPALWYHMDAGDDDIASFFYYMSLAVKATGGQRTQSLPLLTREYLPGLPVFTANYFRALFGGLKRGSAVVFDNYQEVHPDGAIQEVMERGLAQIPAGINVFVISREEPPAAFARMRASQDIALLGWDALKLTEKESLAIINLRNQNVARETVSRLHRDTQGWVAGLVLMTEQQTNDRYIEAKPSLLEIQPVFDYFANEIFRRGSRYVQQFLLMTSLLPKISAATARELTGEPQSAAILHDLTRRNYFTVKLAGGLYEYHPIFRAFLQAQALTVYTADQIKELKRRSAYLLAADGDIESGVVLLQQAEDWMGAAELAFEHAGTLVNQGRTRTLAAWLWAFPEHFRNKNPWVHYWLGVCRLAFAPAEARVYLEKAFAMFERQTDASPLYLTWSRIIESFLLEMHDFVPMVRWLDRYPHLEEGRTPPPEGVKNASLFAYVAGRMNSDFSHPGLASCVARAERLCQAELNADRRFPRLSMLIPYYVWKGELFKVGDLLGQLAPQVLAPHTKSWTKLSWYAWKTLHAATTGATEESLRTTMEGLALSEASGIHAFDNQFLVYAIYGQLRAGNVPKARQLLQRMLSSRTESGDVLSCNNLFLHESSAIVLAREGEVERAIEECRRAVVFARATGFCIGQMSTLVNLACIYCQQGDTDRASQANAEARSLAHQMGSRLHEDASILVEANIQRLRGDRTLALLSLEQALTSMRQTGRVFPAAFVPDDAAALCAMALEAGIHTDYVRKLVTHARLSPPPGLLLECWPWQIRLYTLGHFAVLKDNAPLAFNGKAQKKPLELLRLLIAFGGRDVNLTRLAHALWPDADGDMAHSAFRTTLHRLRRLLGEHAILIQDSRLTLNPNCCWIDVWAFERCTEEMERSAAAKLATHLLNVYRGPFLQDEDVSPFVIERERLRAKFVQAVTRLGQLLEAGPDRSTAIALYERGIEADPLAEALYRQLVCCYRFSNRPAEAASVYRRCHETFKSVLGIEPTMETKMLLTGIPARHV